MNISEDQVAIYKSATHSTSSIVDFVQWGTGGVLKDATQDDIAVAAGLWPNGTMVAAAASGNSLGRDRYATNNNSQADWNNAGGKDSNRPTRGVINIAIPGADTTPPASVGNLAITPVLSQEGAVTLTWSNPPNGDLAGVKVIRSFDTYPSRFSDEVPVYTGIGQTFQDTGLPPGQVVFYTAFAFDDAGNIACPVPGSKARSVIPQRQYIVYEDLKGTGWVDWDTNDFVAIEDSAVSLTQEGISKIDILFKAYARGSYYDHVFNLSTAFNGAATATVSRYDSKDVLLSSTTTSASNFLDLVIFDSTHTALPGNYPDGTANTRNGTGTQVGYSTRVSITLASPALNPPQNADLPPFDPWIHVVNTGQNIHLMQAGSIGNSQTVWNATSPLNGRDLPLGLSFNQAWSWPSENSAIWDAYPLYAPYVLSGGTANQTWYTAPNPLKVWSPTSVIPDPDYQPAKPQAVAAPCAGRYAACAAAWPKTVGGAVFASPVMANIDQDVNGQPELVVATQNGIVNVMDASGTSLPGWPVNIYTTLRASPAMGDVDGDGAPEIVVGGDNQKLYAWHANGTIVTGFPVTLDGSLRSSPALADVSGSSALEIVVATGALKVYIVTGQGALLANWPVQMGGVSESYGNLIMVATPAVGDLDGDGQPDIVAGSTDGNIYAWKLDGSSLNKLWPQHTSDWIYASPVIVDLNGDGYREVVVASGDGRLYAWRGNGFALPGFPVRVRGGILSSPAVVDLDSDGSLEVIFATVTGKVYIYRSDGTTQKGWPRDVFSQTYSSPIVTDLDGDGTLEVLIGSHSGKVYAWHRDGIPVVDWPKLTPDWVTGSPAAGDLDGDGLTEIAAGSYDGNVYLWDTVGLPSSSPWPLFRGGADHSGLLDAGVPPQQYPPLIYTYLPMAPR